MRIRRISPCLAALLWLSVGLPTVAQQAETEPPTDSAPAEQPADAGAISADEDVEEEAPAETYEHDDAVDQARRQLETVALPDETQTQVQQSEKWVHEVDDLIAERIRLTANAEDADEMYQAIDAVLRSRIKHLAESMRVALSPQDPVLPHPDTPDRIATIEQLHASIVAIYDARLRLMEHISPLLRLELLSTDVLGTQTLVLELQFIWVQIHFQALSIPAALADLLTRVKIAPVPIIWRVFLFLLAVGLFRWWRRWFPETLKRTRASLLEIRPRSAAVLHRVKSIWYLEQVRKPIEWLVILHILFAMIELPGINYMLDIVSIITRWILLGWFSVAVLNAISARGDVGLTGEEARLRLRTFRLLATWLVLLGLGLDLAEILAGVATLHAWIWGLFKILAVFVLLVLLSWWRGAIFQRLELEKDDSESVKNMLVHQTGWRSYWSAASGAIWLVANGLRRSLMRQFLRFGSDQALSSVAQSVQADSATPTAGEEKTPLDIDTRRVLLRGESLNERFSRPSRRDLIKVCDTEQGGIIAIIGERGIGKSTMLKQLKTAREDSMLLLQCNSTSFADLATDLANELGIKSTDPQKVSKKLADKGISEIVIDDLQRLVQPIMGGQQGMTDLAQFMEQVLLPVQWVVAVDSFSYQFMQRARADRATVGEYYELRSWSEEQIADLLNMRTEEAGLEPNFEDVQIPRDYRETGPDSLAARNRIGVYRMIWSLAGGNAGVALRVWADCLHYNAKGRLQVAIPALPPGREIENASLIVKLVLRSIAQSDLITAEDVSENLRLAPGAVDSAMHYAYTRGWIEEANGLYRIAWPWYRTVTRVLGRQNLLSRWERS